MSFVGCLHHLTSINHPQLDIKIPMNLLFTSPKGTSECWFRRALSSPALQWVPKSISSDDFANLRHEWIGCKVPKNWRTQTIQKPSTFDFLQTEKSVFRIPNVQNTAITTTQIECVIFHNISLFLQSRFNQKSLKSNPGPKNRQKAPIFRINISQQWNRTSLPLIARFAHPDQWRLPYLHMGTIGNHWIPLGSQVPSTSHYCPATPWIHAISNILFSGVQKNILGKQAIGLKKHRKQTHKSTYIYI